MLRMVEDKLAVRLITKTEERTASGLYVAPSADVAQIVHGHVEAIGPYIQPTDIMEGDIVYFNKFTATEVKTEKYGKLYVLSLKDVAAVFSNGLPENQDTEE